MTAGAFNNGFRVFLLQHFECGCIGGQDGGIRAEPELMSMVGCSGDEFASILRSLGFRLERKRLEAGEGCAKPADTPALKAVTETEKPKVEETPAEAARADETKAFSDSAPAEPEFDEIWRPGRRKEPHRAARSGPKPQRKEREKKPGKERSKSSQRQPRRNQSQGKSQSQRQTQEHAEQRKAKRARDEAAAENSPFAALKDIRKTLAARGRSEQS